MGRDVPSASNPSIGRRSASGAKAQQGLKSGLRCPPAIVPKHELIKVDLKLRLADPVVGADQPLLQIPDGPVRCGTTDGAPWRRSPWRG